MVSTATAHFAALVVLLGGVLGILAIIGKVIWNIGRYIVEQTQATQANTQAVTELTQSNRRITSDVVQIKQWIQDHGNS